MGTVIAKHVTSGAPKMLNVNDDGELLVKADLEVTVDSIDIGAVNVMNSADTLINPATQETLDTINATIGATNTAIGGTAEALVDAGATGSVSAKLRRVTTDLAAMSAKFPATLGQQLTTASMAVVLPATQITTLTPPAAITGFALETGGNLAIVAGCLKAGAAAPTIDSYATKTIAAAANTANQSLIAAPGASKQLWIYAIAFKCDVAGTVSFQDEDDTAATGVMNFAALDGMVVAPSGNFAMPLWKLATNKALEVDTVTCAINGSIGYAIVSV